METTDLFGNSVLPTSATEQTTETADKPKTKTCNRCNRTLDVAFFSKNNGKSPDGLQPWCKDCYAKYNSLYKKHKDEGGVQMCRKCKEFKPLSEFSKNEAYKNGKSKICKVCESEIIAHINAAEPVQYRPLGAASLATCTDCQLFDEIKKREQRRHTPQNTNNRNMTQDNRNNVKDALCWAALIAAFALMLTGYMADREKRIKTAQQRLDKLEQQCDSLQQQIDFMVE